MSMQPISLSCTLSFDVNEQSSADAIISVLTDALHEREIEETETMRIAALDIGSNFTSGKGNGYDWARLCAEIGGHDASILDGPVWMGKVGSFVKRVMGRMDAFAFEADVKGRM